MISYIYSPYLVWWKQWGQSSATWVGSKPNSHGITQPKVKFRLGLFGFGTGSGLDFEGGGTAGTVITVVCGHWYKSPKSAKDNSDRSEKFLHYKRWNFNSVGTVDVAGKCSEYFPSNDLVSSMQTCRMGEAVQVPHMPATTFLLEADVTSPVISFKESESSTKFTKLPMTTL